MIDLTTRRTIVVSCAPHITPYLKKEIETLGFQIESEEYTSLSLQGNFNDCIKLNLQLFTASHVYLLLQSSACVTMEEMYEIIKQISWEEIIKDDGYFSVHTVTDHPDVQNTMFLNMRIKDGVADRFMQKKDHRPDSGSEKNRAVIFVYWKNNEALVYLDTTGESLTKHGYRKIAMKAPLQESLGAALILATRWDRKSPFINPMCGSGTLAIEAAMLAIRKPPGLIRENFGFMHLLSFDENYYQEVRNAIMQVVISPQESDTFIATDNDRQTIDAAKQNARLAGVDHLIRFIVCEFGETPVPEKMGIVMFNPPYGERLGTTDELKNLYASLGNFLKKKCPGYFGYIFTANPDLAKSVGLKPSAKKIFFNGSLECRLLEFEMFKGNRNEFKTMKKQLET